jgi:hypothetical protein
MRSLISRWFLFGLLIGWSLTHATVFGQPLKEPEKPAMDKVRQALDKKITVDYTGQSLQEVINHLRDKSGVPITLDQQSIAMTGGGIVAIPGLDPNVGPMQYRVKATNEKTGVVLRKLLNQHQLNYLVLDDSVVVTTEEMATMRQMRQRVSVDVDDVPLKKAVRDLAKSAGINLVIDPKVMTQSDTPVSIQLDNTGVETALRLLAEMANLKAVRMGNVMFITSEDKAKRILEEEKHQFDNPLNPNIPGLGPVIRGGIGLGGIAMPAPPVGVAPAPGIPGVVPGIEVAPPQKVPDVPEKVVDPPKKGLPPTPPPPPPGTPSVQAPGTERVPIPVAPPKP